MKDKRNKMFNEYETTSKSGTGFKSRRGATAQEEPDYEEERKKKQKTEFNAGEAYKT
jgi:hypothetical protein